MGALVQLNRYAVAIYCASVLSVPGLSESCISIYQISKSNSVLLIAFQITRVIGVIVVFTVCFDIYSNEQIKKGGRKSRGFILR